MKDFVTNLSKLTEKVKEIGLSLSDDGLALIKTIADIYEESDKLSEDYKPQFTDSIRQLIEVEMQKLPLHVHQMEEEWKELENLTTTSTLKKRAVIAGGTIATIGLTAATMVTGLAVLAEAAIAQNEGVITKETCKKIASTTLHVGSVVVSTAAEMVCTSAQSCNAYEKSHPEVVEHISTFKRLYKALPNDVAKSWISGHDTGNSEYLPSLKADLMGTNNDDFTSEYAA